MNDFMQIPSFKVYDPKNREDNVRKYIMYMLNRTQAMFKYNGLPDTISGRMIERYLQCNGFAIFGKHNGELYAYTGGLGGEPDVYYQPTIATVANPAQNLSVQWKIGTDCEVVRNDAYMIGLLPLFNKYASQLADHDITIAVAEVNMRAANIFTGADSKAVENAKVYIEGLEKGDLGIIAEGGFLEGIKVNQGSIQQGYMSQLIEMEQYRKASWFNAIGLNSNWNAKRESLNAGETELNEDGLRPLIVNMLEERQEGIDRVNKMFGTNITVELSGPWADRELACEVCGDPIDGGEVLIDDTQKETETD